MFYIATYRKAASRKGKAGADKKAVSSMKQSAAKVADSCGPGKHASSLVTEN